MNTYIINALYQLCDNSAGSKHFLIIAENKEDLNNVMSDFLNDLEYKRHFEKIDLVNTSFELFGHKFIFRDVSVRSILTIEDFNYAVISSKCESHFIKVIHSVIQGDDKFTILF